MINKDDGIEGRIIRKDFGFHMSPNLIYDKRHDVYDVRKKEIRNMNAYEKVVLGYLLRCCNNGSSAFPSYNKIAEACSIGRMTAYRSIENLVHSGYVVRKSRGYNKENESQVKKYSNVYEVIWEKLAE